MCVAIKMSSTQAGLGNFSNVSIYLQRIYKALFRATLFNHTFTEKKTNHIMETRHDKEKFDPKPDLTFDKSYSSHPVIH